MRKRLHPVAIATAGKSFALKSGAERRTPNCRKTFHAVLKNIAAIWSAALRAAF
jgi:hypothetical protein